MVPKRHHFIPRFYLDRFANRNGQISVVRREKPQEPFVTSTTNSAVIAGFYDMESLDGTTNVEFETMLSQYEGWAASAFEMFDSRTTLTDEDRAEFGTYLALQFNRTPDHHRNLQSNWDMYSRMEMDLTYQQYGRDGLRAALKDRSGEDPTEESLDTLETYASNIENYRVEPSNSFFVAQILEMTVALAPFLVQRSWKVLYTKRDRFITCDRPVALWRSISRSTRPYGTGVATAKEVYFPLEPRKMLVMGAPGGTEIIWHLASNADINRMNQSVADNADDAVFFRPNPRGLKNIQIRPTGPAVSINGVRVGKDVNVWNKLRQGFIDQSVVPVIHKGSSFHPSSRGKNTS